MRFNLFIMSLLLYHITNSQSRIGLEQYYYTGHPGTSLVSRLSYQGGDKWYGEARYNYEEAKTWSLYGGRTFSGEKDLSWSFTPFAGLVMGRLKGGSAGLNLSLGYKKLSFSSASQYTFSAEDRHCNFFFTWSELGFQLSSRIYAGLAIQQTTLYRTAGKWEPGLQLGFSYKEWGFPFYAFNPTSNNRYFVLGVTRSIDRL